MNKSNKGLIVVGGFLAVMGIILLLQNAELKGKFPLPAAQPAPMATEWFMWTTVIRGPLPVFVPGDKQGLMVTFAVLQVGDRMKVLGRYGDLLVVALDDGRKALVQPLMGGEPATDLYLAFAWNDLPEVTFP